MIKFLKNNVLAIAILVIIIMLIIIRNSGSGNFRYNAERWAENSIDGSNLVTSETISSLKGNVMIIGLDQKDLTSAYSRNTVVLVAPGELMTTRTRKLIKKNKGPVLLYSDDYTVSAKAWMALSQSGLKNLYIIVDAQDPEAGKEKFRPDTLVRPESN